MKYLMPLAAVISLSMLATACNDSAKSDSKISTGKEIKVSTKTVSAKGGKVEITEEGQIRGMSIDIPKNAFKGDREYHVSYSEIKEHSLGKYFNPVSPLIKIDNGGGFSDSMLMITIPVNVPDDQFAMAFLYDEKTGKLEGMPLLASDGKKVIVATRGFNHSATTTNATAAQLNSTSAEFDQIVISAAQKKDLSGDDNSGFKIGVDDSPARNEGSCYEPDGFCNGQSQLMMWYYINKTQEEKQPGLFRVLDNDGGLPTPGFWQDDVKAIKAASMLQDEFSISALVRLAGVLVEGVGQIILPDLASLNAFRYAIKLTGEPQFVCMWSRGIPPYGHAMVVYRVNNDTMYIADPNFPGDTTRRIIYSREKNCFLPYNSGVDYPHIYYFGKSCVPNWPMAKQIWKQVEDGMIGNGYFPEYSIVAQNEEGEYVPLNDGFEVPRGGRLVLNVRAGFKHSEVIYNAAFKPIPRDMTTGAIDLPSGVQLIGIHVIEEKRRLSGFSFEEIKRWAGFKWVSVKVVKDEDISPPTNVDLPVTLKVNGTEVHFDTSMLLITGTNFYISGPSDFTGVPSDFQISSGSFHGEGEYNDLSGKWNTRVIPPVGVGYYGTGGTLKVTKWKEGEIEGTFSFKASKGSYQAGGNDIVTVKLEGEFHYPKRVEDR